MIRPAWLCALSLLAGCAAERIPAPAGGAGADRLAGAPVVYVIARGWHSDIGLPVEQISGPLTSLIGRWAGARFLSFGFGERNYLLDRKVSVWSTLAALLPSRSVLLVTALSGTPGEAFGRDNVVALRLTRAGLQGIERRIAGELAGSAAGGPVVLADGPYPGSAFYAARDTYDAFHTCNSWSADVLRAGGLAVPSSGVLLVSQVMGPARRLAARQQ